MSYKSRTYTDESGVEWVEASFCPGDIKPAYEKLQDLRKKLEAKDKLIAKYKEIVESVAHVGIDFGYGNYTLEQKTIDKARELLTNNNKEEREL